MAQGFVTNLNLRESNTTDSDKKIISNLDNGSSIYNDLSLFNGNTQHKSRLINDPLAEDIVVAYGQFDGTKKYKIIDNGEGRNWTSVGATLGAVGEVFEATRDGDGDAGVGGTAFEIKPIREFDAIFETSNNEGWTIVVRDRLARVAFTEGTRLSINNGIDFPYVVVNSDGFRRFQIAEIVDPLGPVWDFSTNQNNNTPGNVDSLVLVRSDEIKAENLFNAYIHDFNAGGEDLLAQVAEPEESDSAPYSEYLENISPDPFADGGSLETCETNISAINLKKKNVILGYINNHFKLDSGVRFNGGVRIVNQVPVGPVRKIGIDTNFGELVPGEVYKIVSLGESANLWTTVGSVNLVDDLPQITSGNFVPGDVYEIINLGYRNVGTNGSFVFDNNDLDPVNDTITLPLHGLSDGDAVTFVKVSGADLINDQGTGSISYQTYYVKETANSSKIRLSTNPDHTTYDDAADRVRFSLDTIDSTGEYRLETSPNNSWNVIADTTDVNYTSRVTSPTLFKGSYFTADTNGNELSGAVVSPVQFVATSAGAAVAGGDPTSRARIVESVGLYIRNPASGEAKRAFTGKDNPWQKIEDVNNTVANGGCQLTIDPSIESRYTNNPEATGSSGSRKLAVPNLKTTSDIAQAGDFIFDRRDITEFGDLIIGESYTITDLGDPHHDWNDVADTTGETYAVGDAFVATHSGTGKAGGTTTIGKAIGQPKFLFTNTNQDAVQNDGLGTFTTPIQANAFTHMIPITVNGESFQLLAFSDASDVDAGNYKIIIINDD